ncbi:hypothetical protein [Burkholderia ubonensis]|uniref:hypothetical protein n=1 Tax=Burkholderia ubonensis TaxID=101571 RepID=UPI000AE11F82|nr:hypothetical protein [Burkholderia ubonensis]
MNVLDLPLPFRTPKHIELPQRDEFGVFHGANYKPILDASEINMATRSSFMGVKHLRTHEALSDNEKRAIYAFNFNPYVVDIREQYPFYDQGVYNRARLRGENMLRADIMPVDLVLTLVLPPNNRLHYHVVSVKDAKASLDKEAWHEQHRERDASRARCWTWQMLRGDRFSSRAWGNHAHMQTWIANVNVWPHQDDAAEFAAQLISHSRRGTLGDILRRRARCLGITSHWASELFAIAVCFGYLYVDHSEELRLDKPLHLIEYRS